jgi:hypothetical protein
LNVAVTRLVIEGSFDADSIAVSSDAALERRGCSIDCDPRHDSGGGFYWTMSGSFARLGSLPQKSQREIDAFQIANAREVSGQ